MVIDLFNSNNLEQLALKGVKWCVPSNTSPACCYQCLWSPWTHGLIFCSIILVHNIFSIYVVQITKTHSGSARNFHLGAVAQGVCLPVGSRDEAAIGVWGTKCPRRWSSVQTLFTDFDCRICNCDKWHPDSWPVCYTVGAKRHLAGA